MFVASSMLAHRLGDSQHPFGNQATDHKYHAKHGRERPFGFASQPYGWFAFSRMMTLQALMSRNYASPYVGQAFKPDDRKVLSD
jgi:hypothetical protein